VDELIETLKRELKLTSLVISHDIPSALLLADEIAFLHQGEIVFFGTPAEFRISSHEAIQSFLNAERRSLRAFEG
jgi:phospholipid/cholesterol/gamma-HCH transport system ATP-binding protein